MDIYAKPGTKIRFLGNVSDAQIAWGQHKDPKYILFEGATYTVLRTKVHSHHTKVFLEEFPDVHFNSVWFEEVRDEPTD